MFLVKWICTAQRWVLNTKDENSYDRFEYTIDHPLCDNRTWMRKLEGMAHMADPENESIMWVYLYERVNYRYGPNTCELPFHHHQGLTDSLGSSYTWFSSLCF